MNSRLECCFVSCDIIGHGDVAPDQQASRVQSLNAVVAEAIADAVSAGEGRERMGRHGQSAPVQAAIWASGGDGGHLAFTGSRRAAEALALLVQLRRWSTANGVGLRICAHTGEVEIVPGADGRPQMVGTGINVCSGLLNFATPTGLVVSDAFRSFVQEHCHANVTFHDPRTVYLKHLLVERVFLLTVEGHQASMWGEPAKSEGTLLNEAMKKQDPWQAIRRAKRLLETDSENKQAIEALHELSESPFRYTSNFTGQEASNPILHGLNPHRFVDLVSRAELVERADGEFLVQLGEEGDSLFVVLCGEIGIVMPAGPQTEDQLARNAPRNMSCGVGDFVGELAPFLKVPRTASLQAIGATSLLSLKPQANDGKLYNALEPRILEYLCNHAPYLSGLNGEGPLGGLKKPWRSLKDYSHWIRFDVPLGDDGFSMSDPRFASPGAYVLVGGTLRRVDRDEPPVKGSDLRLLAVDIPGLIVDRTARFTADEHTKVVQLIHLEDKPFVEFWRSRPWRAVLSQELKPEALKLPTRERPSVPAAPHVPIGGVFISYSHEDEEFVDALVRRLELQGVSCWRDTQHAEVGPLDKVIMGGIEDRTMVLVLSARSVCSEWVQFEVERAIKLGQAQKRDVLCPVALDSAWMGPQLSGQLRSQIGRYNVLDCSDWRDSAKFSSKMQRLFDGLRKHYQ